MKIHMLDAGDNQKIKKTCAAILGVVLGLAVTTLLFSVDVNALEQGKIGKNNIEFNDVLSGKESVNNIITILNTESYVFDFSETEMNFYVRVSRPPFRTVLRTAQSDIIDILGVSKNEACYLGIYATGPSFVFTEKDAYGTEKSYYPLPFCDGAERVDIVVDGSINGLDYAQCLSEYDTPDEKSCDFDVNRRINALDLSRVIQYLGQDVE